MDLSNKNYIVGSCTRSLLIETINELADVVTSTMGPNGRTVIIPDSKEYGKYTITKDGVSVVKAFVADNEFKKIVVGLIKQVAEETVKEAGDGTTTSILLTKLFMNSKLKFDEKDDEYIEELIKKLRESAVDMSSDDVYNIAKVSANGEHTIADNIHKTFRTKNSLVNLKKGTSDEDKIVITNGYYIPNGSIFNIKPVKNVASAKLLVVGEHMTDIGRYSDILKRGAQHLIIIVAPHVDDSFYRTVFNNNLNVVFVKAPGFADHRERLLKDLASAAGTEVITMHDKVVSPSKLALIEDVNVSKTETFFKLKDELVSEVIKTLEVEYEELTEDYDKTLMSQRIHRLNGEISSIYVGGLSEAEQNERFDRYEDAVLAVKCAFEEGYIKGGGVGLLNVLDTVEIPNYDHYEMMMLLSTQYNLLSKSNNYNKDTLNPFVIDPVKVIVTALTRAYQFSKVMSKTNSIIK